MDFLKNHLIKQFANAVRTACGVEVSHDQVKLETPPSSDLGDFAIAAFPFAKECGKSPQMIAGGIAAALASDDVVGTASAVGPYVNVTLTDAARGQLIGAVQDFLSKPAKREKGATL